jgi:D-alanyl-D-alanine carboxypeptidase
MESRTWEIAAKHIEGSYKDCELTTLFDKKLRQINFSLGISADYADNCRLPLHMEATELCECEADIFGRTQLLTPEALACWQRMKKAAAADGINLLIVSAFRSIDYQCELIRSKLEKGLTIEQILTVNAAPGYSEHHSGRALDLTTDDCKPLDEEFENTPAFTWLTRNASKYSFYLSYPRDSATGIIYEPWHWACQN